MFHVPHDTALVQQLHEPEDVGVFGQPGPVEPTRLIVLAVGVIVADQSGGLSLDVLAGQLAKRQSPSSMTRGIESAEEAHLTALLTCLASSSLSPVRAGHGMGNLTPTR